MNWKLGIPGLVLVVVATVGLLNEHQDAEQRDHRSSCPTAGPDLGDHGPQPDRPC